MFMDHPATTAFGANATALSLNLCNLKSPKYEITKENILCRWWTASWDKKNDPQAYDLPHFDGVSFDKAEFRICGPKANAIMTLIKLNKLPAIREEGDFTVQDLIKEMGEPTVLNLDQSHHIKP